MFLLEIHWLIILIQIYLLILFPNLQNRDSIIAYNFIIYNFNETVDM